MAQVICPKCRSGFETSNHTATGGAFALGAATGAYFGSGIGIALGPLGAIAGTVPGALVGGTLAALGMSKAARCPTCRNQFMI